MNFKRKIFKDLERHLSVKQVTVLTGMRRTGKTTLVKQLMQITDIEQKLFFDLEKLEDRDEFDVRNYDLIITKLESKGIDFSKKVMICIDEIQLLPNIPSVIKYLYDHYDIKFIVDINLLCFINPDDRFQLEAFLTFPIEKLQGSLTQIPH